MSRNEHTDFLCKHARRRGLKCRVLKTNNKFAVLSDGKKNVLVSGGIVSSEQSASAFVLSNSKASTNEFLRIHKYKVLPQIKTKDFDEAKDFLRKHASVVLKPLSQKKGRGITVDIRTVRHLKQAWRLADRYSVRKVIEQYYAGNDYRVLVINYKYVYGIRRVPAFVIGDGKHTLNQLIESNNKKVLRIKKVRKKPIMIDESLRLWLKARKLSLQMVPAKGECVILRGTANLHTGGETIDCTADLPDTVKKEAISVAKLLRMNVVGIDYLAKNLAKKRYILEINADPGVQLHHFPVYGQPRDPIEKFLDMLFGKPKKSSKK